MRKTLALILMMAASHCWALSNTGQVAVVFFHSTMAGGADSLHCGYADNHSVALQVTLEHFHRAGYTVVPVRWIVEWALGLRDGSTMPDLVVGIMGDDGGDMDFDDELKTNTFKRPCGPAISFKTRLTEFRAAHPDLPDYSPHMTLCVIASPVARSIIGGSFMHDTWWKKAQDSGYFDICNHSADHEHSAIKSRTWDPAIEAWIPIRGYRDGVWVGADNFGLIDTEEMATLEVINGGRYIASVTRVVPRIFAYPGGVASPYIKKFFSTNVANNHYLGAFCITPGYISRKSDPSCLRRFQFGTAFKNPEQLQAILDGSQFNH